MQLLLAFTSLADELGQLAAAFAGAPALGPLAGAAIATIAASIARHTRLSRPHPGTRGALARVQSPRPQLLDGVLVWDLCDQRLQLVVLLRCYTLDPAGRPTIKAWILLLRQEQDDLQGVLEIKVLDLE